MTTKARSARGIIVDFDLIKIKTQLTDNPKPVDVKKREDFIDRKLRRRVKRLTTKPDETIENEVDENEVDENEVDENEVDELVPTIDDVASGSDEKPKPKPRKIKKK